MTLGDLFYSSFAIIKMDMCNELLCDIVTYIYIGFNSCTILKNLLGELFMRSSGILMPVASLPGKYGIGSFSKEAYEFVDFVADAGQKYWQILPLSPLNHIGGTDSPYKSYSAFAGNPFFIDLDKLIKDGLLTQEEVDAVDFGKKTDKIDYENLFKFRMPLLRKAYARANVGDNWEFREFCARNGWWLNDYALFMALKDFFKGEEWRTWPEDIRRRYDYAMDYYNRELYFDIEFYKYLQFEFFREWYALKNYANSKNIQIIGDVAIYVSLDSADVWANTRLFQLDENFNQISVAGAPPDGFAADGQIWGTPLYRWDVHQSESFGWWMARLWQNFCLCDMLRIDHFRGLDEYFSIPFGSPTAKNGHWEKGPGMAFFHQMWNNMGHKPVIVEDLGMMTDSVRELVRQSGFPNMKVLEFAFDPNDYGAANDYMPHNIYEHCVVYTGTHDNAPVNGWFADLSNDEKELVRSYFGTDTKDDSKISSVLVNHAMMSRANLCVVPIQDYLGLGNEARVNDPSHEENNWFWRLDKKYLTKKMSKEIFEITRRYGRLNWENVNR